MPTILPSPAGTPASPAKDSQTKGWRVTGRMVLLCLIGFFGTVMAVNVVMIRAAVSTHGGAEKISSYRAGLDFARHRRAAQAQQALNWQVDIALPHNLPAADTLPAGARGCLAAANACLATGPVTATVRDAAGAPLDGLDATLILSHPTDSRRDRSIPMTGKGAGVYEAAIDATPGHWIVDLDLDRAGEQMFRSSGRVVLN